LRKGTIDGKVLDKEVQLFTQKFWNWDVKITQEIRRKDCDKIMHSFHEVVA
jgi:hypothetical protein